MRLHSGVRVTAERDRWGALEQPGKLWCKIEGLNGASCFSLRTHPSFASA